MTRVLKAAQPPGGAASTGRAHAEGAPSPSTEQASTEQASTEQVERELAVDMVKRGVLAAPVLIVAAGLGWGVDGALSSGYGLVLIFANFLLAAAMLGWAAKKSPAVLMATAFGGFALRMGLLVLAVQLVKEQAWVEVVPLGITILVAYLGLLFWETRFVSASLAFPGLKPRSKGA